MSVNFYKSVKNSIFILLPFIFVFSAAASSLFPHSESSEQLTEGEAEALRLVQVGQSMVAGGMRFLHRLNPTLESEDHGTLNDGVYRINLTQSSRPLVVKISHPNAYTVEVDDDYSDQPKDIKFNGELWSDGSVAPGSWRFREYLRVHALLGEIEVVPQLVAVIEYSTLKPILPKMESREFWIGLVMEEVPRAHALSRATPPASFLASWSESVLIRAVQQILEIRRRVLAVNVIPRDAQMVVTPDGDVWLIDVDAFRLDAMGFSNFPVTHEITKLVGDWEMATGKKFDTRSLLNYVSQAAKTIFPCELALESKKGWR